MSDPTPALDCPCICCVDTKLRLAHGRIDGTCSCLDHPIEFRCDCDHCVAFARDEMADE